MTQHPPPGIPNPPLVFPAGHPFDFERLKAGITTLIGHSGEIWKPTSGALPAHMWLPRDDPGIRVAISLIAKSPGGVEAYWAQNEEGWAVAAVICEWHKATS